jgi:uncharacterized protein
MKVRRWNLNEPPRPGREGLPPLEARIEERLEGGEASTRTVRTAVWLTLGLLAVLSIYIVTQLFAAGPQQAQALLAQMLSSEVFWSAVAVGLLAQVIDGALGMAYGVTSTTFLMASGVSPAMASASVHMAEVFTTGVSGVAHARMGNVNKKLFLKLLVPGIIGAVAGAYVLSSVDGKLLKPWISAYLIVMGLYIISKVYRRIKATRSEPRHVAKLALFGGFVDATGGGGWGPVVTTTLVGSGHDPRTTIGSVNFAEFFLTLGSAAAFVAFIGVGPWMTVAGLVIGGLFAAPFAACLVRWLPARTLMLMVGALIVVVSSYNLYQSMS